MKEDTLRDEFEKWRDSEGGWPAVSECGEWFIARIKQRDAEIFNKVEKMVNNLHVESLHWSREDDERADSIARFIDECIKPELLQGLALLKEKEI